MHIVQAVVLLAFWYFELLKVCPFQKQVGLLRQKLDNLQKTKYEMAQNYDAQLQALKIQVRTNTGSYFTFFALIQG